MSLAVSLAVSLALPVLALPALLSGCMEEYTPPPPEKPPGAEEALAPKGPRRPASSNAEGSAENRPPNIKSISITPTEPTTKDDLTATAEVMDRDSEVLDVDYMWILNGQERPDLGSDSVNHAEFDKHDKLAVQVRVSDGDNEVFETSQEIEIRNSAPTFKGDPTRAKSLESLVLQAEDPDEDELTFSVSGAPAGLTVDPKYGRISYQGSETEPGGDYTITFRVDDGDGGSAQWELGIAIAPGMTAEQAREKAEAEAAAAAEGEGEG